jgi:hypothetical protein
MDPKQFRQIIKEELEPVIKTQQEHTEKIDSLTVELHQVHQLADATLDEVRGRYNKNKKEIDEIKDHLKLPKEPFFGDQQ